MQPAPFRLQQAIWTAFKAARSSYKPPATQSFCSSLLPSRQQPTGSTRPRQQWQPPSIYQSRFYTDIKGLEVDKKVEDAKTRISESLESRAESIKTDQDPLKKDETIIHTLPESSSIVYNPDSPGETAAKATSSTPEPQDTTPEQSEPAASSTTPSWHAQLPSQLANKYSRIRHDFNSFMDNFQTHIFTASKRLNDLTGYSSIERLKRDIEDQEHTVRQARQLVRDSRSAYSLAIETRSTTQREVNDLLHRKHAWSPADLERFTGLYRSDHANEQAEQKAHDELAAAEAAYEEASTKLSKSILARYHEEQVWSDKIRQMSTWGTWGLMGLNVLLFIVFQILVEPWRRRRLVRGFEEKVQEALKTNAQDKELIANLQAEKIERSQMIHAETLKAAPAEGQLEDKVPSGVSGSADDLATVTAIPIEQDGEQTTPVEQAIEDVTAVELLSESASLTSPSADSPVPETPLRIDSITTTTSSIPSSPEPVSTDQATSSASAPPPPPSFSFANLKDIPSLLGSYTRLYLSRARVKFWSWFDEKETITTTRRDLTGRVLEGAFFGAMGAVTLFWVVGVGTTIGPR